MRAILAGGGTGGHVIPALAIAQELRTRYVAEVRFIGTPRGLENKLVPAAGFALELIEVGALKSVGWGRRLSTLAQLPRAALRSRRFLRDFRPQVVIGVGGYASGPAMLAAVMAGIPTLIFEPNRVPGFANRMVARWASAAAVQFEETGRRFPNAQVTGTPVRKEFFEIPPRPAGAPPTLLVFGGSQGAAPLNRVMMESAAALKQAGVSLIHQTGERDYNQVQAAYQQSGLSAEVSPFIERMWEAFARADLLLCRAGASTVAEVAAARKPAIFVPFPRAADDHQRRNAEALVQAGAAGMISEAELTSERLVKTVGDLLADGKRLAEMSAAGRKLAHPDAAQVIAGMAARLAGVATE